MGGNHTGPLVYALNAECKNPRLPFISHTASQGRNIVLATFSTTSSRTTRLWRLWVLVSLVGYHTEPLNIRYPSDCTGVWAIHTWRMRYEYVLINENKLPLRTQFARATYSSPQASLQKQVASSRPRTANMVTCYTSCIQLRIRSRALCIVLQEQGEGPKVYL